VNLKLAFAGNDSLTVGAHIQGSLNNPRTTLFSDPGGLSNQDILSYLIMGQPSSQIGENKVDLLLRAAQALNFGGSGGIHHVTDSVRKTFGLTELGVETETTLAEKDKDTKSTTSFIVGKYLSPSLYLSYSLSLLDQVNVFRVRYKLWKGLYLQSEGSSVGRGADLLYNFGKK
jgi:translocation and assembly module TamB